MSRDWLRFKNGFPANGYWPSEFLLDPSVHGVQYRFAINKVQSSCWLNSMFCQTSPEWICISWNTNCHIWTPLYKYKMSLWTPPHATSFLALNPLLHFLVHFWPTANCRRPFFCFYSLFQLFWFLKKKLDWNLPLFGKFHVHVDPFHGVCVCGLRGGCQKGTIFPFFWHPSLTEKWKLTILMCF